MVPLRFDVRDLGETTVGDVPATGIPTVNDGENQNSGSRSPQGGPLEFFSVRCNPSPEGLDAVVGDDGKARKGKSKR